MDKNDDKICIKKTVHTHKSGHFTFSSSHSEDQLQALKVEANVLYTTISDVPILPDMASMLEDDLIKKSIFGTAAIEGNPLSQDEVNSLLSNDDKLDKLNKVKRQIQNLKLAYNLIKTIKPTPKPFILGEDLIKTFHKIITEGCENPENVPGQYRTRKVKVGDEAHGGIYVPPKILDDVKLLMSNFIKWINSPGCLSIDGVTRACMAHYYLGLIHPFDNGNGRTARAIEAVLLRSAGYKYVPHMLSNYYYKHLDEYFMVFSQSERGADDDITPFIEFFLKGFIDVLEEIRSKIFGWIKVFTLRDYYSHLKQQRALTKRQYDLLTMLLESPVEFTFKDLFEKKTFSIIYEKVGERTARRDIKYLKSKQLIVNTSGNAFALNYNVLSDSI